MVLVAGTVQANVHPPHSPASWGWQAQHYRVPLAIGEDDPIGRAIVNRDAEGNRPVFTDKTGPYGKLDGVGIGGHKERSVSPHPPESRPIGPLFPAAKTRRGCQQPRRVAQVSQEWNRQRQNHSKNNETDVPPFQRHERNTPRYWSHVVSLIGSTPFQYCSI